ncbi:MAG: cell wall metabolism sensor histidine kinase WalK [Verrucomicrobia bacterium]|nr:cell wall metabolism sensor histidine kinase WalK [Verrucomicrobiota bacterium]MCG2819084.1 cell wall metabolism sensor histidine kinase WalK [Actinomycetes bacterium]
MRSLKGILFFRYAVAVTVIVAVIAVALIFPLRSRMLTEKEDHLRIEAENLAALLKPYFLGGETGKISETLSEVSLYHGERLTVIDSSGAVLGDSWANPLTMEDHASRPEMMGALGGESTISVRRSVTVNKNLVYAAAPIEVDGRVVGAARVAAERGGLAPVITPTWLIMVGGLALMLAVLFGLTFWTRRTLSSDLEEIGRGLEQMVVYGDLERMPQPELSELRNLAVNLDTIAGKVRESYRLLESERDRLEAILVNINAGILVLGADGRAVLINPVAERILGVAKEEALGKTVAEIHPAGAIDSAVGESLDGVDISGEVTISSPKKMTLRVAAGPIRTAGGGPAGVICVLEDVTSTRKLERMRSDFVANVSHELRTPVASFRATVDAMMGGAIQDEEMSRRFLENLDREADRLIVIIADLLALSRLESEELSIEAEAVGLGDLIREVIDEKVDIAAGHEVELEFEGGEERYEVRGDRKLIKTACGNLVDNAIKYNEPGGSVRITIERTDGEVAIHIEDTGIGIPSGEHDKVFERFFRIDKARSRETGGTGLGLSIVKHVAELHGGSVRVVSTKGYGSTFTITLPATRSAGG